jgi:pyruvate dehydrogenase phosphatase
VTPTLTRPLLLSEPDVTSRALRDTDRFIILGSSGFWKLMSNEKAARVVNTSPRDGIAETLAKLALEKGARQRGKKYAELLEIPASNCVSGNNGNQNLAFRPAYHDDITVIVVYLDRRANREGVKPKINSYRGYDDTVRQSEFRNFYNNANA